jgi:hypothetical protein
MINSPRSASLMMVVLAAIGFMVGTGVLVTDEPLRSLCQRECWLNDLLYALLGEQGGKTALAVIWYLAAGLILALAIRLRAKRKRN